MRFSANEKTVPRLHLIGTLAIVMLLTLTLGAFFSWRSQADYRASLERMQQASVAQQKARLTSEMDSAMSYLEFTRARTQEVLRKSLREQVDTAMQIVQAIYAREMPRKGSEEVKRQIIEALRPVRFYDGRGYYFIDDMAGKFILLPTAPQFEGKTLLDNKDDQGHLIMRGLIGAARMPAGEGYDRYRWYTPDNPKLMSDKLAYVRYFAPFDWLIGTGDYTYKWEQLQKQEVISRLRGLRFGESGHFSLIDREGRMLLTPDNPALEGQHFKTMPALERAGVEQLVLIAQQGGGMTRYSWTNPKTGAEISTTALVRTAEPWGWILVASMQDDELQASLQIELTQHEAGGQQRLLNLALVLAVALLVGLGASLVFARWSGTLFLRYHKDIESHGVALAQSEALFRAVFENAAVGICQVSPSGNFLQVNQEFCRIIGYASAEILSPGFTLQKITLPEDLAPDLAQVNKLLAVEHQPYNMERRYLRQDGSVVWVNLAVQLVCNEANEPLYFISAVHDITASRQAQDDTKLSASVFTHAREGIMITEVDGTIINVNDSFTRITGYSRAEVLGQNPRLLKSGHQDTAYYEAMWRSIKDNGHWYGEVWNRKKNGEVYAEMQTISAVRDSQGITRHYVSLFSDITALKEHENQLERIAHFDALTNLPNRVLLADRLNQAMLQAQRRGQLLAVAYLDLDGFKGINDSYGHDAGDRVLMELAKRMKTALREGDTLARIGGDEFVAVLVDLPDSTACMPLLNRLLVAAAEPFELDALHLRVSASLGVTFFPQPDSIDAEQLQRQADQAMYQAKLSGKNRYHVFDAEQDRSLRGHHESLEHIRHALEADELVLYYQPKVNMRTGQVIGAEALIRWQHPEQGLLAPGLFLPVIENHPLAVAVGEWVLHTALQQIERWSADGLTLPISVNIGARQLQARDFVARLQAILAAHPNVSPERLELEVLETSALEDIAGVSQVIESCRKMGVMFALDDFGTGYSSLTYLKRLPVALLKIDQSFVRDMLDDADDLAILKGVIGLANAFKRQVIAEGVETVAHGTALLQLGCELAQGYGVARPMPATEMPAWVAAWRIDPAWLG